MRTRRTTQPLAAVIGAWCTLSVCGTLQATVINVPGDQPTIQAGINAATNGDTVLVAPGTYNEAINFNGKAIRLESTGGADATTITGAALGSSVVTIPTSGGAGDDIIQGFTITGGTGTVNGSVRRGGGVNITGGSVQLLDCTISGNTAIGVAGPGAAGTGGGVAFAGDSLVMHRCLVTGNSAGGCSSTGAGVVAGGTNVLLVDCDITSNGGSGGCAGIGGGNGSGLYLGGVTNATIINCTIHANTAGGSGGGAQGGGIYNASSNTTFINCRITANSTTNIFFSTTWASGLYHIGPGNVTMHDCTISNNIRSPSGPVGAGGVYSASSPVSLYNCIVTGNTGAQLGSSSVVASSCVEGGFAGPGNISGDPLFVNASGGDYRLQDGSPCRDTGNRSLLPSDAQDLDGDTNTAETLSRDLDLLRRVVNNQVDMGAFEWQRTCLTDISRSSPGVAGDGFTNIGDLLAVIAGWGPCDQCNADVNNDDVVNITDLLTVIAGWGACP